MGKILVDLKAHKNSECHVEIDEATGVITFWSYKTEIVTATPAGDKEYDIQVHNASEYNQSWNNRLKEDAPFSPTTARQLGWFLGEWFYGVTYKQAKESALCGNVLRARLTRERFW